MAQSSAAARRLLRELCVIERLIQQLALDPASMGQAELQSSVLDVIRHDDYTALKELRQRQNEIRRTIQVSTSQTPELGPPQRSMTQ